MSCSVKVISDGTASPIRGSSCSRLKWSQPKQGLASCLSSICSMGSVSCDGDDYACQADGKLTGTGRLTDDAIDFSGGRRTGYSGLNWAGTCRRMGSRRKAMTTGAAPASGTVIPVLAVLPAGRRASRVRVRDGAGKPPLRRRCAGAGRSAGRGRPGRRPARWRRCPGRSGRRRGWRG